MKVEIAVLAQSIERIEIELQRCRACLADLLTESIQATHLRPAAPEPIAQTDVSRHGRTRRTQLYAYGEMRQKVLAIMGSVGEMSLTDLLHALEVEKPGTRISSVWTCCTNLVQDGQLVWVSKGVYRTPEHKPHLSVVQS
jgi:hypothetical protein